MKNSKPQPLNSPPSKRRSPKRKRPSKPHKQQHLDLQNSLAEQNTQRLQDEQSIAERRSELQRLQSACDAAIEQLDATNVQKRELDALIITATSELESIRTDCDTNRAQIFILGTELTATLASQSELANQISAQESELAAKQSAIARNQLELDDLEAKVLEQRSQLTVCQEEEHRARSHVDWLLSQVGEFERLTAAQVAAKQLTDEELACVNGQIITARLQLHDANEQVIALQEQIAKQQQSIELNQSELAALHSELDSVIAQKIANEQFAREAEQHAETLLDRAETMANQIEQRAEELLAAQHSVATLKEELQSLEGRKATYDNLASESAELNLQIVDQRKASEELEKQFNADQLRAHELEQTIAERTSNIDALNAKLDDLAAERASQESKLAQIADEAQNALQQQTSLQHELQTATDELRDKQSTVQDLRRQIDPPNTNAINSAMSYNVHELS